MTTERVSERALSGLLWLFCVLHVAGCGTVEPCPSGDTPGCTDAHPLGRPRFVFDPGPEGRAVGVRAIAETASGDTTSPATEIVLVDARAFNVTSNALNAAPSGPDGEIQSNKAALCGARVGDLGRLLEPVNERVCWLTSGTSLGVFSVGNTRSVTMYFAREGRYVTHERARHIYFPPDLANGSVGASFGCAYIPAGSAMNYDAFSDLVPLSFSTSLGSVALAPNLERSIPTGFTVFLGGGGVARAFQLDSAASLSLGIAGISSPVGVAVGFESETLAGPSLVAASACAEASSNSIAAPASQDGASDAEQQLMDDVLQPLLQHISEVNGEPPGPHVIAGSNADAFAALGRRTFDTGCASCPPTTVDDFVDSSAPALNVIDQPAALARIGAQVAPGLRNVLPGLETLDAFVAHAACALFVADRVERRRLAGTVTVFMESDIVRLTGRVGEEVAIAISADEVATLLGVGIDSIVGATVTLTGSPNVGASEFELPPEGLSLVFTPRAAGTIYFRLDVDVTTAADPNVVPDAAVVELAPRVLTVVAGDPAYVGLTAPRSIGSGGSVALNALVVDENGSLVSEPVSVRFEDADGNLLGRAITERGVATIQYVPVPTTPAITSARSILLVRQRDGMEVPGVELVGHGFSQDATVTVDGQVLDPELVGRSVTSESALIALELSPGTRLALINPGGQASNEVVLADHP